MVAIASGFLLTMLPLFAAAQTTCPNLTRNLSSGSRGQDVVALQNFLIEKGNLAVGNNTGCFGRLTEAAVRMWQSQNGIVSTGTPTTTGFGAVEPRTRAAIAISCRITPTTESGRSSPPDTTNYVRPTIPADTACSFNGSAIARGASVIAYQSGSVSFGAQCVSENRTCSNGILSGNYQYATCAVSATPPAITTYQVTSDGNPYTLKSALAALKTADPSIPEVTIKLADGTYDMNVHSNDNCGGISCITFNGISNPSRIKIIGNIAHPENVVLKFSKPANTASYWAGGFYFYENKTYGTLDGFTMDGPYNGWSDRNSRTPDQTPFPDASSIKFTTMALWAKNGAKVTMGPNVRIKGFYFGIAADGPGTVVHAEHVTVENCGDAGFIAWKGSTLYATDSEASWCAAYGWGLGAGYVSESADPNALASYSDTDPATDDAAIRTYSYNYSTGVRNSVEIPLLNFVNGQINKYGGRAVLNASNAKSHDNLVAGYVANIGGQLQMNNAYAYRNGLSSVTVNGPVLHGGVVAQVNGSVQADNSFSYHNGQYGFVSLLGSEVRANNAKAFDNIWHGFYALEQGSTIYSSGASSFSYGADQMFGFGAERNATIYVNSSTKAGVQVPSFSFFDPLTGSTLPVSPKANTQWDFSPAIGTTGNRPVPL